MLPLGGTGSQDLQQGQPPDPRPSHLRHHWKEGASPHHHPPGWHGGPADPGQSGALVLQPAWAQKPCKCGWQFPARGCPLIQPCSKAAVPGAFHSLSRVLGRCPAWGGHLFTCLYVPSGLPHAGLSPLPRSLLGLQQPSLFFGFCGHTQQPHSGAVCQMWEVLGGWDGPDLSLTSATQASVSPPKHWAGIGWEPHHPHPQSRARIPNSPPVSHTD